MSTILERANALRAEAWIGVIGSTQFAAFKALDDAVVALGGKSAMPVLASANGHDPVRTGSTTEPRRRLASPTRLTQGDAAADALTEAGEPLPIGRFMEAAMKKGAVMGGDNPLSNFRSAVSKDKRFRSFMRNGQYFWWFTASPLPQNWNEAVTAELLTEITASDSSSQKGGDADAATT